VTAAQEGDDDQHQIAIYDKVEALAARYRSELAEMSPTDREAADRLLARRLIDLRREAAQLMKRVPGARAVRAVDHGMPFVERRAPPKSIEPPRAAPNRHAPKFSVGGDAEAWCGKCKEITDHHIVAMVGEVPKQVVCVKCKSRHGYRIEPTARASANAAAAAAVENAGRPQRAAYTPTVDHEAARKAEVKRQLEKELNAAEQARPYDPRERYKQNEIVYHPEHGRGKIENVLKGSMLVRFRDGLRPLNLK
jgi:hypothetical protein